MTDPEAVGGRYRPDRLLGRGGAAVVHAGVDDRLGRAVAIKRLAAEWLDDPAARARFAAEARFVAQLNHPAVAKIFDAGVDVGPGTGPATPFMIMELVVGRTLAAQLASRSPLPPRVALRLAGRVANALEQCHAAGIVHGDVTPGNVMMTRTGQLKLIDFGSACSATGEEPSGTAVAGRFATATYLSPEQASGAPIDARSDIYALGCLFLHLLVGRPPFLGDSFSAIASQHVISAPPKPSEMRPDLGTAFDSVLQRCLAKNPDDRYRSVQELEADLSRLSLPHRHRSLTEARARTANSSVDVEQPAGRPDRSGTGRRLALTATVLAALMLPIAAAGLGQPPYAGRAPAALSAVTTSLPRVDAISDAAIPPTANRSARTEAPQVRLRTRPAVEQRDHVGSKRPERPLRSPKTDRPKAAHPAAGRESITSQERSKRLKTSAGSARAAQYVDEAVKVAPKETTVTRRPEVTRKTRTTKRVSPEKRVSPQERVSPRERVGPQKRTRTDIRPRSSAAVSAAPGQRGAPASSSRR